MSKIAKIIAGINFKGGVGKSTITSILASEFNADNQKAVVLNIALGQSAESINEIETIDFSSLAQNAISVSEIIAELSSEYDYIFVDTPGELSDELVEIAPYVDYFIVPFDKGKRVFEDTMVCIESIFTSGIIESQNHNIALIYNKYNKVDTINQVQEKYQQKLSELEEKYAVKFNTLFTQLSYSDAIETMEENRASIDTLSAKNKVAYKIAQKRIKEMSDSIKEHMKSILK